jgi:hypothetical protein
LLAPRPTPKMEDHPLLSVRGCLFNIFAANLHSWRPFLHPQPEDAPCCGDRDPTAWSKYVERVIQPFLLMSVEYRGWAVG